MSFRFPVRVYWEDTDAGGIVFYANDSRFRHWHGIWHLFVLGGSLAQFVAIAVYVL